jgi:hypothetical protein
MGHGSTKVTFDACGHLFADADQPAHAFYEGHAKLGPKKLSDIRREPLNGFKLVPLDE